jgi:hypothetical protein
MKITIRASSIVFLPCFFLLAGCGGIYVPNVFGHDEVPDEIKAQPRLVEAPTPQADDTEWPRLGDVPFKPKDFSPKPVYDHYMNELEYHRSEAETAKNSALANDPALDDAALQNNQAPLSLRPPRFPKE